TAAAQISSCGRSTQVPKSRADFSPHRRGGGGRGMSRHERSSAGRSRIAATMPRRDSAGTPRAGLWFRYKESRQRRRGAPQSSRHIERVLWVLVRGIERLQILNKGLLLV